MRTLVIGDIHGNYRALQQVLQRSNYDPFVDRLICLGDYVDGYPESYQVISALIKFQEVSNNRNIYLLGNHDAWYIEIFKKHLTAFANGEINTISTVYPNTWIQGGRNTFYSYVNQIDPKPDYQAHVQFLNNCKYYHIENNICFVHAGWNYNFNGVEEQFHLDREELIWNRDLYFKATHYQNYLDRGDNIREEKQKFGGYDKVFIGHTQCQYDNKPLYEPHKVCNIINLDTWAGWGGPLTAHELETGKIYQSDHGTVLYPNHKNIRG